MAPSRNPWDDDPDVSDEADLWFLPADDTPEPEVSPLPRAERVALFPHGEWRAAEGALAPDLAALAYDFGRLEERLRGAGEGARRRIALQEVASLGWWTGDRLSVDRLALWLSMQIGATGEDSQALGRGAWAVRRLTGGPAPLAPRRAEALAALLGLTDGAPLPERLADACDVLDDLAPLHPVVQGAVLFHLWRQSDAGPARDVEAAVLGARLAGSMGGAGAFLPLTLAGFGALSAQGAAERRLAAWIAGAHQAVLAALMHLERLAVWQRRAAEGVADLSGRTPPRLVRLLGDWPSVSAPMAEAETGASRAAVQRNLDILAGRGLIRELTGQGRYRVWAARLA
ncbi:HTH DNA binding domain-containing protein [Gemmobacter megaterium]|uniref:HTH DNA binding domain-containing protein n=1 Tax=Gemmobacter megaterium TaxID=1086013 RepID=A0A1N7N4H0_9RHOB|nr:helix-turn-helix domain-containing protein [Gemmobacter megaterium]GGE12932.1 DNA-binding protein [Gemmobacter megaterium]SIS93059.1 HTH DNA binding domain-containing protein [Gemmobacter megaterium]